MKLLTEEQIQKIIKKEEVRVKEIISSDIFTFLDGEIRYRNIIQSIDILRGKKVIVLVGMQVVYGIVVDVLIVYERIYIKLSDSNNIYDIEKVQAIMCTKVEKKYMQYFKEQSDKAEYTTKFIQQNYESYNLSMREKILKKMNYSHTFEVEETENSYIYSVNGYISIKEIQKEFLLNNKDLYFLKLYVLNMLYMTEEFKLISLLKLYEYLGSIQCITKINEMHLKNIKVLLHITDNILYYDIELREHKQ